MGSINLYKISKINKTKFFRELSAKYVDKTDSKEINDKLFSLFTSKQCKENELSWNWILSEFNQKTCTTTSSPKAILLVEKEDGSVYAATFGSSYFLVDKYCDRNFGFDFASRLSFKNIRTTTLTTPNSQRNKTISSFINYHDIEFDSGESFAKIKANIDTINDFDFVKSTIEIGTSIRFFPGNESLETISRFIDIVEKHLKKPIICHIPVFSKVSISDDVNLLNERLENHIKDGEADEDSEELSIIIPDLDVIGTNEIINRGDDRFEIKLGHYKKEITNLSIEDVKSFCKEIGVEYASSFFQIKIARYIDDQPIPQQFLKDIIEYTDDEQKCLLSGGSWYRYNTDYLRYLAESLNEITIEYHPEYDFDSTQHQSFLAQKYADEKDDEKYAGKSASDIQKSIKATPHNYTMTIRIRSTFGECIFQP